MRSTQGYNANRQRPTGPHGARLRNTKERKLYNWRSGGSHTLTPIQSHDPAESVYHSLESMRIAFGRTSFEVAGTVVSEAFIGLKAIVLHDLPVFSI
ncbi:hypothetical protein E2542_SST21096 [Spatholobus suberectus]|nr:hypothetical protein E2542_SST21096 [Spatholobus suberectus]